MLYDPLRKYLKDAACTDPADTKLFFAPCSSVRRKPSVKTQAAWDQAKTICNTLCPVSNQCRRDTLGENDGVWGGRDPFERWKIRTALTKAVKRWPQDRRLRWGEELHRLRTGGTVFREIQKMTGIPEVPAMYLIREWERHLKDMEAREPAEVVALAPVELESGAAGGKTPFPETPGQRHLWARHNGIVQDCWYRAQTADGLWVYVLIDGRGRAYSSYKWIPVEDVQIYAPQIVVVQEYVHRPDATAVTASRCGKGHLLTPDNVYVEPEGRRRCRSCRRLSNARLKRKVA